MKKTLKNGELITFCEQLAMILHSGISVLEGLSIMTEEAESGEGKEILKNLYAVMEETGFLYMALQESGVFPEYMVQMTEIGEMSGRLDEVMASLARRYEREEAISDSIRGAVLYPSIMFGMLTVIILVLVIKVMPGFEQVLAQMGSEMTGVSAMLLKLGQSMSRYSYIFMAILLLLAGFILYISFTKKGKEMLKSWTEHFFLTKGLAESTAAARFAGGMAMCLASGLDTEQSLGMTGNLIDHKGLREKIDRCKESVSLGEDLSEALKQTGIFKGIYCQMITIGYKAGSMEQAMSRAADIYEEELEQKIQSILSVLEPTMIAVLSVIIGSILLSVMLPLMAVMSGMG